MEHWLCEDGIEKYIPVKNHCLSSLAYVDPSDDFFISHPQTHDRSHTVGTGPRCAVGNVSDYRCVSLLDLNLYVPSTIFQLNRNESSWVGPVLSSDTCVLLKDHNAVTPVRLEPAAPRSRVKHSTTPADACLTADPGVAISIPVRFHTFAEIDHEIISTVILLPSADYSRRVVVSYKWKYVHEVLVNRLFSLPRKKYG